MPFWNRADLICCSRSPCRPHRCVYTVVQVASYWSSESGLHIAGLHLASQEAIPVFAVAEPNIPSTWTVPRQVFSEEMTGSGPMLFTPKWAFYWVWRFMCHNLGSTRRSQWYRSRRSLAAPKRYWPGPDLVFLSCKHLLLIITSKGKI